MYRGSLSETFAAGTVLLPFCGLEKTKDPSWASFADYQFDWKLLAFRRSDSYILETVDYLVRTDFICATTKSDPLGLTYIRIYIVPADKPGIVAWLRTVKQAVHTARTEALRAVLGYTDISVDAWEGRTVSHCINRPFFEHCEFQNAFPTSLSLSHIFQGLASPSIEVGKLDDDARLRIETVLQNDSSDKCIPGLRSKLYPYQARSVAKMLQEELCLPDAKDPTYVAIRSPVNGGLFFVNPSSLVMRITPEQYTRSRRGACAILAEDPGSGKTIMILALVLSTKQDLPVAIPSCPYHTPRISTPAIVTTAGREDGHSRVPTLRDLALHRARTSNIQLWENVSSLPEHLGILLLENNPFYMDFYPEADQLDPLNLRKSTLHPEKKILLSAATLVVVPTMLRLQWEAEILKHVEDGALRVLVLQTKYDVVSVENLANSYDMVLMTYDVFSWAVKCRFPCSCTPTNGYCLPGLLHICWKRLVVDEGNICGSGVTELVTQLQQVKAENRWIVTGTPTANLVGGTIDDCGEQEIGPKFPGVRWSSRDREDLNCLAYMIGGYLAIPPFHMNEQGGSGIQLFKKHIIEPLCHPHGPQFGGVQALSGIMNRVFVRHQAKDRAKDIVLPPMTHETVLLDLDRLASTTYNIMQTVIAVNAIDSQREGADYLFSPQNVPHLRNLMQNVTQALFWHVDDKVFDLDQAVGRTKEALQKLKERQPHSSDVDLLENSLQIQRQASQDLVWRSLMTSLELPYRLCGLLVDIATLWTPISDINEQALLRSSSIARLRLFADKCPLNALNATNLMAAGEAVRKLEKDQLSKLSTLHSQSSPRKTNKAMAKTGMTIPDTPVSDHGKATKAAKSLTDIYTILNAQQRFTGNRVESSSLIDLDGASVDLVKSSGPQISLEGIKIGRSGSAKLDYILDEVRKYSKDEKFIIFSAGPLTLAHVADGLTLLGTRFLQLSTGLTKNGKEHVLTTFKTSEDIRALLMELKYGARGLNITEASRIIFCEPVWGLDVESQAVKRAHRIGQTRPITVKTLAIRCTFEEEIMKRRAPNSYSKDVCVDDGMRGFLMRPAFISHRGAPAPEELANGIPLVETWSERLSSRTTDIVQDGTEVEIDVGSSQPAKRTIRFTEPADNDEENINYNGENARKKARPCVRFKD